MSLTLILIIVTGISTGLGISVSFFYLLNIQKRKKEGIDDIKNTTFLFSGNLKQTTLIETIQFLEIGNREGILHIFCGRRKGYLTFLRGKVIDAFYRNSTGREAVMSMFEIDEGDFYFEPKTIYQPRIIKESILDLAFKWDEKQKEEQQN